MAHVFFLRGVCDVFSAMSTQSAAADATMLSAPSKLPNMSMNQLHVSTCSAFRPKFNKNH